GIPEDVVVRDYCLGTHWSYVEADSGMGVSFTTTGGARRGYTGDLRGMSLREVAELSKSWCFEEASLGVAALNAWYSQRALLDPLGCTYDAAVEAPDGTIRKMDAFEMYRPQISAAGGDARVVVVGHFPHVERIEEYARLTVLERKCSQAGDVPDPACEYVIPGADYLFMTGVTLINKTAPRLLDLAANATTVFVGPSVIMAPFLFRWGGHAGRQRGSRPDKARFG
ncbi:MAG: Rossmann-like domain-containing protein, partial [Adlercreutzia equolifaciens]